MKHNCQQMLSLNLWITSNISWDEMHVPCNFKSRMYHCSFLQIRTIAIIAEGIPENLTRKLNKIAHSKHINIIGPATVGGIKPGCFKIGNTGGMLDNILASRLYRPGSVAYVSRSGGMSNELNNIISLNTDGVYEGVAIGGDRYGTSSSLWSLNEMAAALQTIFSNTFSCMKLSQGVFSLVHLHSMWNSRASCQKGPICHA